MASDDCEAGAASNTDVAAGTHWEGDRQCLHDCGSHTHTLVPDTKHRDRVTGEPDPRVLIYVSSYPLGGRAVAATP